MKSKNLAKIMIILITALFLLGCAQTQNITEEKEDLVIGSILPLSGDAAPYGIPLQQVAEFAVTEINNEGGIDGKNLAIVYENGDCSAKGGSSAAQKLISIDEVNVILGGLCSGETLGAAPIAEESQVILFSSASGSPDITESGEFIFRNFPSDASSGSKVAKQALANSHSNIAILSEQTDYAQAVKNVFKNTLLTDGGSVVLDEQFTADTTDFRTPLAKIKSADPDAIYLIAQTPAKLGLVLKQLRELNMDQQIYTNEFAAAEEILESYREEIEGAIFAEPAFDENSPNTAELISRLKAEYGDSVTAVPTVYLATTYDAVYLIKDALENCGEDTECIKTFLYSIKDRSGTAGKLSIDDNGDAEFEYEVKMIQDGQTAVII
ncbi:ABC transporter substrate-binding protein [Candidatus Woesearchaeota archaeon]|nr:ABC transporter substrate-binding protein [Candidatus Woesearchaeota archaeon]